MHTWQTELVKDLKSIEKGRKEAGELTEDLNFFIKQLEETEVDMWRAIAEMQQMHLGLFATHLENYAFHKRADIANQQEQANAETQEQSESE